MSKVMIVSSLANRITCNPTFDYIGVERGALALLEANIPMVCAIGDFDSITMDEYARVASQTKIIKLAVHKNESDSEYAIQYASKLYQDIYITGVIGGRVDHFISLYHLLAYGDYNFTIVDSLNDMKRLKAGEYSIVKQKKYLSLFALEPSMITIENVAYPLTKHVLTQKDVFTLSNEIQESEAKLIIHYGSFVLIQSDDSSMI